MTSRPALGPHVFIAPDVLRTLLVESLKGRGGSARRDGCHVSCPLLCTRSPQTEWLGAVHVDCYGSCGSGAQHLLGEPSAPVSEAAVQVSAGAASLSQAGLGKICFQAPSGGSVIPFLVVVELTPHPLASRQPGPPSAPRGHCGSLPHGLLHRLTPVLNLVVQEGNGPL